MEDHDRLPLVLAVVLKIDPGAVADLKSPRTKAVIQARAKSVNKTVTDCLCLCGLGKEIVQVEGLDKVLSELKAQGRNLNQLTTLANMGKVTILRGDALADKYEAICGQLCHLLREVN